MISVWTAPVNLVALLCLLAPAGISLLLLLARGIVLLVRWRRDDRSPCRRHDQVLLPTSLGLIALCQVCDAGQLSDTGRWEFAPPVEADHTL